MTHSPTPLAEKPTPKVLAWEEMSFIELVQFSYMMKKSNLPEDKDYLEDLNNYVLERARYEQNKR